MRLRPGRASLAVVLGFLLAAAALMWPVLRAPHQRVYGQPSDPLGEVWRLQQFRDGQISLVGNSVASTANIPDGVELRRSMDVTQVLYDVPAVALAKVLPPIAAYNFLVWIALWSSGVAALLSLRWLGSPWPAAVTAGALFMVAPVHMAEAELHVGLAMTAPLPVLMALGVAILRRPRLRLGVLYGAIAGACAFITAYHSLLVLTLSVGLICSAAVVAIAKPERRRGILHAGAAAAGVAAVALVPLLVVMAESKASIDAAVGRPAEDVAAFSLSPWHFVDRELGSYIGMVALALAVAGALAGRGGRVLRGTLAAVTLAGLWVSLSPRAPLLGPIAPAGLIHEVLPYWRVYGRAEVVAVLGVACLAGLAVARLAERPEPVARIAAAALAVTAVADVARMPPPPAADAGHPDARIAWLRSADGSVAEFPLYGFEDYRIGEYLFRQIRHGRPLLNGGIVGTRSADLGEAAVVDRGRQSLAALRVAGVRRAVLARGYPVPPGAGTTIDLGSGARGIVVAPEPGAVVISRSAYPQEAGPGGAAFRWMDDGSALRVVSSCRGTAVVRLTAVSQTVPRALTLAGRTTNVQTTPTPVVREVAVMSGAGIDLPIATDPPAARLPGGDPRVAAVGVYDLRAGVRCRP